MAVNKTGRSIRTLVVVSFLVMVIVNALANILAINGVTTGRVSDSYPNLFAPAGLTFAIWGLIYLLLAGYTLYQLGLFQNNNAAPRVELFGKVGFLFSVSSLANAAWIFAWHYHRIALSMLLMIVILVSLILIVQEINKQKLSLRERIFIRLPFSVYFGWITVATIANATVLLVSLGWNGWGISESAWAVLIITVGLIIGMATTYLNEDVAYGLVIIWAYVGILIKHTSANGFGGQYPSVIAAVIISLVFLFILESYMVILRKRTI